MVDEQTNNNDYELVSKTEVEYLRKEVEKLKKNPLGDTHSSKTLLSSMDQMSSSLNKLINIFETASDDIVRDYKEQTTSQRMDKMMEQNEKLAKGMIVIADLLKELKDYKKEQIALRNSFDELQKRVDETNSNISKVTNQQNPQNYPGPMSGSDSDYGVSNDKNPFLDSQEPVAPKEGNNEVSKNNDNIDLMDVPPPPR